MNVHNYGPVKQTSLEAVIIRADGTRVELGKIAYWHRNPFRVWMWNIGQWFKKTFGKGKV